MLGDDLPGGLVKLPCAAIVAQSFPKPQDLLLIGFGQGANCGQHGQKSLEVRLDGLHLRLLEHDLAQPDRVRVARAAPGQFAGMRSYHARSLRRKVRSQAESKNKASSLEIWQVTYR